MIFSKFRGFETGPASPRTTLIGLTIAASILLIVTILVTILTVTYEPDPTEQRTEGEVTRFIESGDDMQSAVFRFTDVQGKVYTVTDKIKSTHIQWSYKIGEKVPVVYNSDNPSGAWKDGGFPLYLAPVLLGLMSLLFYGGAALVWRFRSHFQKDYEARRGRTIVTTINNDGSITQTTHSSAPVFRSTGIFLAGLGVAAWFGALWFALQDLGAAGRDLKIGFLILFVVMGGLLLLGARASLRHAKLLRELE